MPPLGAGASTVQCSCPTAAPTAFLVNTRSQRHSWQGPNEAAAHYAWLHIEPQADVHDRPVPRSLSILRGPCWNPPGTDGLTQQPLPECSNFDPGPCTPTLQYPGPGTRGMSPRTTCQPLSHSTGRTGRTLGGTTVGRRLALRRIQGLQCLPRTIR